MKKEAVMKYIKAGTGLLACVGVTISPDLQGQLLTGFVAVYSVLSAIQGKFKQDDNK